MEVLHIFGYVRVHMQKFKKIRPTFRGLVHLHIIRPGPHSQNQATFTKSGNAHRIRQLSQNQATFTKSGHIHKIRQLSQNQAIFTKSGNIHKIRQYSQNQATLQNLVG
jgi:diaminopimelate epimerase